MRPSPLRIYPRWEGVNVSWAGAGEPRLGEQAATAHRPYQLSELLRTIGSVLDELGACNATIAETPDGFVVSAEIAGHQRRHVYTYVELARRLAA